MYQKILVPVDGSPTSSRGLQEAIKLAKLTGARLRLMHVVDETLVRDRHGGGDDGDRRDDPAAARRRRNCC